MPSNNNTWTWSTWETFPQIAVSPVVMLAILCLTGCIGNMPQKNSSSTASVNSLQMRNSALPTGAVQAAYMGTLSATGGKPPYSWSVTNGALPPGLALSSATGTVSGIPTMAGAFSFMTELRDSDHLFTSAKVSLSISASSVPATSSSNGATDPGTSPSQPSNPTSTVPSQSQPPQGGGSGSAGSSTGTISVSAKTLSFGNVKVGSNDVQTVTLSNSGNGSITISNVSVSGAGVGASGVSLGLILAPQQSATLDVTFAPAATGSVLGSAIITSNAVNSPTSIAVSGTGIQIISHSVDLTWTPSTSTGIVGYDVYRGSASGGPYIKLTTAPVTTTNYSDTNVLSGQTYYYVLTAEDSSDVQSVFSTAASASIP
jgi:Abnormal spindle-like microcephaly-assoc'd, ASPM-SPD-2-Hydin/Putative Ig domain